MAGCDFGFSVAVELIVRPPDARGPFEMETLRPDELGRAVEEALTKVRFAVGGESGHRIVEVHAYRVAPTFSSMRRSMGLKTPWIGRGGVHTPLRARRAATKTRTKR